MNMHNAGWRDSKSHLASRQAIPEFRADCLLRIAANAFLIGTVLAVALYGQSAQPAPNPPDEVTLGIIVVSSEDEANRVLDRLHRGEDFGALARKLSIDTTTDQGGLMGRVSRRNLRPEMRNALQNLHLGDVSSVVRVPLGFAILKLIEDRAAPIIRDPSLTQATDATGSVKYAFGVSGQSEANVLSQKESRQPGWNPDPHFMCDLHRESVSSAVRGLRELLASAPQAGSAATNPDVMNAHFTLAQIDAYQGDMAESVHEFEKASELAKSLSPDFVLQLHEALGIAYLHKSEMENDIY